MRETMHENILPGGRRKTPTRRFGFHSETEDSNPISTPSNLTGSGEYYLDLPDDSENVEAILAEMEAQRSLFDVAFQNGLI